MMAARSSVALATSQIREVGPVSEAARKVVDGEGRFDLDLLEFHRWVHMVRYPGKVGPGVVVEEVPADSRKNPLGAEYRYRLVTGTEGILDQEGKGVCVIHVGMGNQHMPNLSLLGDGERAGDGAGIDRHLAVNQEGRHPALGAIAPEAPKDPKIHALSITGTARVP